MTESFNLAMFAEIAAGHALWEHPLLMRCRTQRLNLLEVRLLIAQIYRFESAFSRIMANLLACSPDEEVQLVLVDSLYEELGQGDRLCTVPERLRRLTRDLGISDNALESAASLPETRALLGAYLGAPQRFGSIGAIGALCFTTVGASSAWYRMLHDGVVGAAQVREDGLSFFDERLRMAETHKRRLSGIVRRALTVREANQVTRAIESALDAQVGMLDGVERQIESLRARNIGGYAVQATAGREAAVDRGPARAATRTAAATRGNLALVVSE